MTRAAGVALTPSPQPDGGPVDWVGTASRYEGGSGGGTRIIADVRFTLASRDGCVDHFTPGGSARIERAGDGCAAWELDPAEAPLAATDGELVVDRSTTPATFTLRGATTWQTHGRCWSGGEWTEFDATIGGDWADSRGSFDGAVIGGSSMISGGFDLRWALRRADVDFPAPGDGCAAPPTEQWSTTTHVYSGTRVVDASVTWTRASTDGCLDRYTPSGTITPAPAAVAGGWWGSVIAPFDGTVQTGASLRGPVEETWSLTRDFAQLP